MDEKMIREMVERYRRDTGEPFGIAGLETQVYNKVGGEWKITHVHYSTNGKAQD